MLFAGGRELSSTAFFSSSYGHHVSDLKFGATQIRGCGDHGRGCRNQRHDARQTSAIRAWNPSMTSPHLKTDQPGDTQTPMYGGVAYGSISQDLASEAGRALPDRFTWIWLPTATTTVWRKAPASGAFSSGPGFGQATCQCTRYRVD